MALDSSVMNVSIATVAEDVGTTVTGIQGAITAYTLVMAMFMIPGGKVGAIIGRKRAFMIGCVIYGCGSFTTALAPNLPVLLFGWSFLEGSGGADPARDRRARRRQTSPPNAVRPLTDWSRLPAPWRSRSGRSSAASRRRTSPGDGCSRRGLMVLGILVFGRRIADAPAGERPRIDLVGARAVRARARALRLRRAALGRVGLVPAEGRRALLARGLAVVWLMLAGLLLVWLFLRWEARMARGEEPLVDPAMLQNRQLTGGLTMFFFQYLVQMGVFFVVPLYLSVALGLSALETGARLLPLSVTLLAAAIRMPRFFPDVSPRRVVRLGFLALLAGAVC